jgi:hypothetical protein
MREGADVTETGTIFAFGVFSVKILCTHFSNLKYQNKLYLGTADIGHICDTTNTLNIIQIQIKGELRKSIYATRTEIPQGMPSSYYTMS